MDTGSGAGMTPHAAMPDLIRHPYATELGHCHNHGYRLGGRYDEGLPDTASEAGMTRDTEYLREGRYATTLRHAGLDPASICHGTTPLPQPWIPARGPV